MRRRFLVVGLGRFGAALAETLVKEGCDVVAVDREMAPVEAVKDRVTYAAQLDATDPAALASIEAVSCHTAVVSMGDGFEQSVLCVAALKEAGVKRIVARARDERQGRILMVVGAHEAIEVESELGRRLARTLVQGS